MQENLMKGEGLIQSVSLCNTVHGVIQLVIIIITFMTFLAYGSESEAYNINILSMQFK